MRDLHRHVGGARVFLGHHQAVERPRREHACGAVLLDDGERAEEADGRQRLARVLVVGAGAALLVRDLFFEL